MDFTTLSQSVISQGPWAVLFVTLFVFMIKRYERQEKESNTRSDAREEKLMAQLEKWNDVFAKLVTEIALLNQKSDRNLNELAQNEERLEKHSELAKQINENVIKISDQIKNIEPTTKTAPKK